MHKNHRRAAIVVAAIVAFLSLVLLLNQLPTKTILRVLGAVIENTISPSPIVQIDLKSSLQLKIPEINVNAVISTLGINPDGEMETPKDPRDVGWYKYGPSPGEVGSAVIAGHYGPWSGWEGSVFDNLAELRKGDKIYIEDGEGSKITFVVRELRTYDPVADALEVFNSSDGKPHLNLVTCKGEWNNFTNSYPLRLVVFSDREV